jgi:5-methylcytosine-specific restriction protein A
MPRAHNFTRKQRAQLALRANGCCELCGMKLKAGEGQADHILAVELGGESTIENGRWICHPCHKPKTADDIRRIRKADRQRDRHTGAMPKSKTPIRSRGFPKAPPQRRASTPLNKWFGYRRDKDA